MVYAISWINATTEASSSADARRSATWNVPVVTAITTCPVLHSTGRKGVAIVYVMHIDLDFCNISEKKNNI